MELDPLRNIEGLPGPIGRRGRECVQVVCATVTRRQIRSALNPPTEGAPRHFLAVHRVALRLLGGAPLLGSVLALGLWAAGGTGAVACSLGLVSTALVWGFLGVLSAATASGLDAAQAVVAERQARRRALRDPGYGHLSSVIAPHERDGTDL